MDLSSWETINAASGAGASFMAKAASHFHQVTGNISGNISGGNNSENSSNIKNSVKPFAKSDDSNEEAWIMGRKYYTQSGKTSSNINFFVKLIWVFDFTSFFGWNF